MKKILHIISSPRGEDSHSIKLGRAIVNRIKSKFPDSVVTERNLTEENLSHLNDLHISAFFKPVEQLTSADKEIVKYSDAALAEVGSADFLVIGTPMYNFGIHSSLKAWIDQIVRVGISFKRSDNGFRGLLTGKKVYLAMTSGSVYQESPMQSLNFVTPYMIAVLGFIGLHDVCTLRMEGTSFTGLPTTDYQKVAEAMDI